MKDKELLELAAKASGFNYNPQFSSNTELFGTWGDSPDMVVSFYWCPLDNDGDALRLMVQLKLRVRFVDYWVICEKDPLKVRAEEPYFEDVYTATRRAIVRSAAYMGRNYNE